MYRTKKDVERHVADILSKVNSENEKNLRGYTFARLFFQVKDYDSAKRYLAGFLNVRDHHAPAHKLLAQIYEVTHNADLALQSYKRSLEIDSHQNDIVLKICELYCQLSVDPETARYWADRAETVFPHNEIIFKLRECIISAEGEPDNQNLEHLIATELAAQPKNVGLRIRLLRLYLDTERFKEAYEHCTMIESKKLFPYSVEWYYLLTDIFEAYQEECGESVDSQFYMHYLSALDRLVLLTVAERHSYSQANGKKQYSASDAAAALLTFDQLLKNASELKVKESSWLYFLHHMKGQLFLYMASLLLKRAKMDQGNRKEAARFSSALAVVCYTFKPVNILQEIWFSKLEDDQKNFTSFFQQGSLRTSFIGHVITNLCNEDKSKWLKKLKLELCASQVKERIYSRVFGSVLQKEKLQSSFFISDSIFESCNLEFPSEAALQEYEKAAYKLCPDSLHHLVWLELHRKTEQPNKCGDNLSEVFKGLQYSNKNLKTGSCESLCVLDLEAFLFAAAYQAHQMVNKRKELGQKTLDTLCYPPDIADAMCTNSQASWWRAAYGLHTCTINEKLGESRRELQHGLEVIRGVGCHGMEVQLVIHLAQKFADKADFTMENAVLKITKTKKPVKTATVESLQLRAIHYWNIALEMLSKMSLGQPIRTAKDPLFSTSTKAFSKEEMKSHEDNGKLYIAVYLMDSDKHNEAAEILSKLSTPYGSFYLALTLQKLASQEEQYSNTRSILLNKAKSSIHETMDRIKDDKMHPLNKEIYLVLGDIENKLAHFSTNNSHGDEVDETDAYDESPDQSPSIYKTPLSHKLVHSTPRPVSHITSSMRSNHTLSNETAHKHFEPSPERLDAQIRALTLNQDTVMKTLLEQQKSYLETSRSIADTLKHNTEVLEQLKKLMEDLKIERNQPKVASKKLTYPKQPQVDEEDYNEYDPNVLDFYGEDGSEDYRNSGYGYTPSSRMVNEAAASSLNYVMPPGSHPALNHYGYQYPPHPVLGAAMPIPERPPFYHPPPGQGLPFSEGQQLPQFQFHVASPLVKHPPPVMSGMGSIPHSVAHPPPLGVVPPPQPPTSSMALPSSSPWSKNATVPHAFQIPLPPSVNQVSYSSAAVTVPPPTTTTSAHPHDMKNLLKLPATSTASPFGQPVAQPSQAAAASSIFAGLSAKTPDRSRCSDGDTFEGSPEVDHDLEREVMGDFKPVIPLPAEVVVETGEEDEEVLFEDRAKLYRFIDQEWKERGTGTVKILHHVSSGRVRLLMRRDQVLKVCANHYITSNLVISPLKSSDRTWTWTAQDFADEELRVEHFCIRFKTVEIAAGFKTAFDKAITIAKETESKGFSSTHAIAKSKKPAEPKPFGAEFLPKASFWSCPACYIMNATDEYFCVACETAKPGSTVALSGANSALTITAVSSSAPTSLSNLWSQPSTTTAAAKSVFGGFTFSSSPTILESSSNEVKDRQILVVSTKSKSPQVSKVAQASPSPFSDFSFQMTPNSGLNLSVKATDSGRTVSVTNAKAATKSVFGTSSVAPSSVPKSSESDLSKMLSMVQNIGSPNLFGSKDVQKETSIPSNAFPMESKSPLDCSKLSADGDDFVPTAEFKPVVALPALVDLKTGEEDETVIFAERAKLFRFDSGLKEWKERGIGELKILHKEHSDKYRILMRRDQVLKICANHYILPEMKLTPLGKSDKAWCWFAQDFSEDSLVQEQFTARFKNAEIAKKFQDAFRKCQSDMDSQIKKDSVKKMSSSDAATLDKCAGNVSAFDQLLKGTADSWQCSKCSKSNMNRASCVYCNTPKGVISSTDQKPLSELFKPDIGSWECNFCYVRNIASVNKCASCESARPSAAGESVKPLNDSKTATQSFGNMFKPQAGSWECENCYVRNGGDTATCVSCESVKKGSSPAKESSTVLGKFQFGTTNTFQFNQPSSGDGFVFGGKPVVQPATFSFGATSIANKENEVAGFKPPPLTGSSTSLFGSIAQQSQDQKNVTPSKASTNSFASLNFEFGSNAISQSADLPGGEFRFGSPQKYEFNFSGVRPHTPPKTPKSPRSPATPSDAAEDDENDDSDVDNIYFQPVIPLPPKVELKTGEEEEKVLFCKRAKLFRFSNGEWKERGLGDIKILLDEKTNKHRLLMRREQVLKVCLNHYLTSDIKFEKRGDKSWSWAATDFSENEPSPELLAVRFKTSELAEEFKTAVDAVSQPVSPPSSEPKSTTTFSFKSETPDKSSFSSGSLAAQFGTALPQKSVFGNSAVRNLFGGSKDETSKTVSPFTFSVKDTTSASTFFGNSTITTESEFTFGRTQPSASSESEFTFGKPISFAPTVTTETEDDDIEVVYEAAPSPDQVARAEKLKLPRNFFLFENRESTCPGCIGCTETMPILKGELASAPQQQKEAPENKDVKPEIKGPLTASEGGGIFSSNVSAVTFADLAQDSGTESTWKTSSNNTNVFTSGPIAPLFSNLNTSTDNGNDEVVQSPDVHFEPVIPMPDLIEVKTGEEDEKIVFQYRAKLFRYDPNTKQWKERGVGDIKILSHKEKVRYRIILRRDQVHNLACNHCITEDMNLQPMATSNSALCWTALDFSDAQGEASQFAVRFKLQETLNEFQKKFNEIVEIMKEYKQNPDQFNASSTAESEAAATAEGGNYTEQVPSMASTVAAAESSAAAAESSAAAAEESHCGEAESDEDEEEVVFCKRVSLEVFDETIKKFKPGVLGELKIVYDDTFYGYRITMATDSGELVCDHIIAVQTCLKVEGKSGTWSVIDMAAEPYVKKQFKATFSSKEAMKEFKHCFEEGKEIACKSGLVENSM